jgi:hypothetical protein
MNDLEYLESRLALWRPRRPSAKLDARIADTDSRLGDATLATQLGWMLTGRHLAWAALGCLLVAGMSAPHLGGPAWGGRTIPRSQNAALAALSNTSSTASLALAHERRNAWTAPILGWTKGASIPSSSSPLEMWMTNRLLPRL